MRVARFEGRGPKAALGVSSSVFARNVHGDASVALAWGPARRSQPRADRGDVCSTKFQNRRGVR